MKRGENDKAEEAPQVSTDTQKVISSDVSLIYSVIGGVPGTWLDFGSLRRRLEEIYPSGKHLPTWLTREETFYRT